jgi:hypothetical protein
LWISTKNKFLIHAASSATVSVLGIKTGAATDTRESVTIAGLEWRTQPSYEKADVSLRAFLLTTKNPRNIPRQVFALKTEKQDAAVCDSSERGADFLQAPVADNFTTNTRLRQNSLITMAKSI